MSIQSVQSAEDLGLSRDIFLAIQIKVTLLNGFPETEWFWVEVEGPMIQRQFVPSVTGRDQRKYFASVERKPEMGKLLSTGFESEGHKFEFRYETEQSDEGCEMVCVCGWVTDIGSFRHSWSVIEIKVKVKDHLEKFGITTYHPAAFFKFNAEED